MRNLHFTLLIIAIHFSFTAQDIGYFGKKTSIEVNVGAKPDFNKRLLYRDTKLTASLNYGFVIRRQTKSNKGIGFSMSSTKLNFNADDAAMLVPLVSNSSSYNGSNDLFYGELAAGMRINRYALFLEIGSKNSTLPIGFSNEIGLGFYTANIVDFSYRPSTQAYSDFYYSPIPTKATYGLSDLHSNSLKKSGAYFHWRINVKIPVSESFLINMSYVSSISFPFNPYYNQYGEQYVFLRDEKPYVQRAAYMDIGTFKIGGVFVF